MLDFSLTEEQMGLVDTANKFVKDQIIPIAAQCDEEEKFPHDVFCAAWELGLIAPLIPEAYGGLDLGELDHALLVEEIAYGCTGIQTSFTANTLAATPLVLAEKEAVNKKYLGMLTEAPKYAAYALTEPGAGSDAGGIQTLAKKHGNDWVITGQKCFITNASFADWFVVFATVDREKRHSGIMAFVVDAKSDGLTIGKKEKKMGQRASDTASVIFDEVKVPGENVLAEAGHGFKLAMNTFDRTRPDISAAAAGLIRRALDESLAYATERRSFGTAIANHQMVQTMLANMKISYEATHLLTMKAAWNVDQGSSDSLIASVSKAYGADEAMRVATDAVQVFGGNGYMRDYPVEKLMRDAKVLQIYEGTSQIQRMVIAKSIVRGAQSRGAQ